MLPEDIQQVRQIIQEELAWFLKTNRYVFDKNIQILDRKNIQLGRANGTKIGTATDQKIGFYGATPVDKPATVSDASTDNITGVDTVSKTQVTNDLTSCKNAINAIIDRLQELGLIA
jgi:hypothetical protein